MNPAIQCLQAQVSSMAKVATGPHYAESRSGHMGVSTQHSYLGKLYRRQEPSSQLPIAEIAGLYDASGCLGMEWHTPKGPVV